MTARKPGTPGAKQTGNKPGAKENTRSSGESGRRAHQRRRKPAKRRTPPAGGTSKRKSARAADDRIRSGELQNGPVISRLQETAQLPGRRQQTAASSPRRQGKGRQAANQNLRIVPLGGMREIGKNMTVYEYGQDLLIVDCGIAFPEEDMPGVDVIIPDFSYLERNQQKIRAIILTHGHEDHIGALSYLLKAFNIPVYGNKMTLKLVESKLNNRGARVKNADLRVAVSGDQVRAGAFTIEFIHVNHSIADANALAITCPAGTVLHSGDFKIDYTPIHGQPMDLHRIAELGKSGVLALVSESTNVHMTGVTPSEHVVGESLAELFAQAKGRIFVTTFASNIFRLQQIITAAEHHNRHVVLLGRSMLNVFTAANSLDYITMRPDTLIEADEIDQYAADELVLITTGSQGEPMSALTRMAFSEHRSIEIVPGDLVILSSSMIPGNEKSIYRVIDELFKRGANVIYESLSHIHVSGHAYQDELKLLLFLARPRYFIPAHGEYRHLKQHANLAHDLGIPWNRIFLLNNGDILELNEQDGAITGFTDAAGILVDGSGLGDIDQAVLQDRRLLADDGLVAAFILIDRKRNQLVDAPDIQARGFIYDSLIDQVIDACRQRIAQFANNARAQNKPIAALIRSGQLHDQLRNLLFERTRRRPMILVSYKEI